MEASARDVGAVRPIGGRPDSAFREDMPCPSRPSRNSSKPHSTACLHSTPRRSCTMCSRPSRTIRPCFASTSRSAINTRRPPMQLSGYRPGQVAHMAPGRDHPVAPAEIAADGPRLDRRFDDHHVPAAALLLPAAAASRSPPPAPCHRPSPAAAVRPRVPAARNGRRRLAA